MARASRWRSRAHPGFVSTDGFVLQDKQHDKARASRGRALVSAHRGHTVEAPGELYLECRYRCRLSTLTELANREMRPSRMVENGPNERTWTYRRDGENKSKGGYFYQLVRNSLVTLLEALCARKIHCLVRFRAD